MHFRFNDINRLKVKGYKKLYCANRNHKKARVVILTPYRIDLLLKVTRDEERHFIIIKIQSFKRYSNYTYIMHIIYILYILYI